MYFTTIYIPDIATARRFVDVMERYPDIHMSIKSDNLDIDFQGIAGEDNFAGAVMEVKNKDGSAFFEKNDGKYLIYGAGGVEVTVPPIAQLFRPNSVSSGGGVWFKEKDENTIQVSAFYGNSYGYVKGERMTIKETQLYIVHLDEAVGIYTDSYDELTEKYPTLHFIDNPEFNLANNIGSLMCAIDRIDRCYICEADLIINNPDVIRKYEYRTAYFGTKVRETDDWCFRQRNGVLDDYRRGGTDCWQGFGISYWDGEDSEKLKADLRKVWNSRGGRENLWEMVPLKIMRKNYRPEIRECSPEDITEIDTFIELIAADPSYAKYPGYEEYTGV